MSVSICLRPASSHSHSQGEKPSRIQYLFALTVLVCACLRPASSQQHSLGREAGPASVSVCTSFVGQRQLCACLLPASSLLTRLAAGAGRPGQPSVSTRA